MVGFEILHEVWVGDAHGLKSPRPLLGFPHSRDGFVRDRDVFDLVFADGLFKIAVRENVL